MAKKLRFIPPCDASPLFDPLTDADANTIEAAMGRPLPDDLIRFLMEWNGIKFTGLSFGQRIQFPLRDSSDEDFVGVVFRIYGIANEKNLDDLRYAGEGYHFSKRVPQRFLCLGDDGHWNSPCISLGGDDYGEIYYWSPGEGWPVDEEVSSMEYLWWVARSFEDFWSLLRVVDGVV